ncbi:PKD domain-containing protein [Haloferax sp. AS1]|uniref:PKD domain-containing protein n=1 Tax=Haloferax sp. AS1 TaxID=2562277 RepID=UPI00165F5706|nr:PKD domain-containing protein [Haloferax sp. AS1]MBC9987892.1 PKD domain-containing protein [Haloferax sp. AS1]
MSSAVSNRWQVLAIVSFMIVLAGCGGNPLPADNEVTISDQVDRDCDGASRSVVVDMSVVLGIEQPADGDTNVLVFAETGAESQNQIHQFESVSGWELNERLELSASDLNNPDGPVAITVRAVRPGFFEDRLISSGSTTTFEVESAGEDSSSLDASFTISNPRPNRSEETQLTVDSVESQCDIVSYSWDVDGDGDFEQSGNQITVSYSNDGHHEITLRVEDSGGVTRETTQELLVFHDPDGDGITTAYERDAGTDPYDYDTDNDLFSDRIDPMPKSALVPTGLVHVALAAALYLGAVPYRGRVRRWIDQLW